jgi:mannose-6-phosphate isomerase-like protein (cupin superfamily)
VLRPWNFNAYGRKDLDVRRENFLAVDYMDLHILKPNCGIGLHRHRENQEAFLMLNGRGLMVIGDWCKLPERERCFEIRTLLPGSLTLLKGGQLHGLMNVTDEDGSLFMFGGYD